MRKWFAALVVLFVLGVACIYIFIPGNLDVGQEVSVSCTQGGAYRFLSDENNWQKWWPDSGKDSNSTKTDTGSVFTYKGYNFKILQRSYDMTAVQVSSPGMNAISTIKILPLLIDSVVIQWECTLVTGLNPFIRLQKYIYAGQIEDNMSDVLLTFKQFMGSKKNIYGYNIEQIKVTDTLLITTKKTFKDYPGTDEIYELLNTLKKNIASAGAKETHYPMMHVRKTDSNYYEAMVAIPINTEIKPGQGAFIKRMAPGKILVTDALNGGDYSVKQAFKQLENYVSDYKKVSPAIPFESLETDRLTEQDTLKWSTRIYYPVF